MSNSVTIENNNITEVDNNGFIDNQGNQSLPQSTSKTNIKRKSSRVTPKPIPSREELHRTFGGEYSDLDFIYSSLATVTTKILHDRRFDKMNMTNHSLREGRKEFGKSH